MAWGWVFVGVWLPWVWVFASLLPACACGKVCVLVSFRCGVARLVWSGLLGVRLASVLGLGGRWLGRGAVGFGWLLGVVVPFGFRWQLRSSLVAPGGRGSARGAPGVELAMAEAVGMPPGRDLSICMLSVVLC